ncbi:MAG: GNAT family N-acetyltransferase [Clostridiaceae bacterium]|jgi:ribosomal protein S18 acetylase RimI-like enzyme|nr:GNAT family N-acetyltransferase [Clostridiaceae bacterium]
MESAINHRKHIIEFKSISGQYMIKEVKQLFLEYAQSLDIDLCFQNFESELETLPGKYGPPAGALILALVDGIPAGCVALRKINEDICEMKRLYVSNEYRGLGIGKQLISKIIEKAGGLNYSFIRLDTLSTMKKAQELYKSYGFYDIEPYIYNPFKDARFLELKL